MLPLRASNATRILAETQDEYIALAIRDEVIGGINHMTSVWEPTPQELADLNAGGAVRHKGQRIYLDELPEDASGRPLKALWAPECGIHCEEKKAPARRGNIDEAPK